ncbi:hypothetical protein QE152_g34454 [Popillia japonica]|uniref:SAM domain-containing protein n=1 Tax=Popillia japonica TaxID=7064 RepID=A0AAW1IUA4_POPJA
MESRRRNEYASFKVSVPLPYKEEFRKAETWPTNIQGTADFELFYPKNTDTKLVDFADADWAGDQEDRKSTTGYLFKVFGGTICWSTRKQTTVAMSSTEAVKHRAAGGEKYLSKFKDHRIDLPSLKLLNDEDLQIIGVDDTVTRINILKNCGNFQMQLETRKDLIVDIEYIQTVLNQIIGHLHLHHANLACAILREDIVVCDIKLQKVCKTLIYHVQELENEVCLIQEKILPNRSKKKRTKVILLTAVTIVLLGFGVKTLLIK